MKKVLLLGGSQQQVVAIEKARELGFSTVLCDYLPDNPGQYHADKFYLVSTTDKEAVLEVAKKEKINGILAYASDPAAPTAAYVAEQMGLPTNPSTAVETLCNKDTFRAFLKNNGFHTPLASSYHSTEEAKSEIKNRSLPLIVKPVDSSGSKGVSVVHDISEVNSAVEEAFSFSRAHRIIAEEFIEKKHKYLIGGDIFVYDGKIVVFGLLNCHRNLCLNPLVPEGKSYPLILDEAEERRVHETLQKLVDLLQIRFGSMNVELVVDKNNRVWPIDIGPRAGGNMIPDLLELIFGVDLVELAVLTAMGEPVSCEVRQGKGFFATHNLHSAQAGIYKDMVFSEELEKHIIKKCLYKKPGDTVEVFDNAPKALGIIFMRFDSEEQMQQVLSKIHQEYKVVLA